MTKKINRMTDEQKWAVRDWMTDNHQRIILDDVSCNELYEEVKEAYPECPGLNTRMIRKIALSLGIELKGTRRSPENRSQDRIKDLARLVVDLAALNGLTCPEGVKRMACGQTAYMDIEGDKEPLFR